MEAHLAELDVSVLDNGARQNLEVQEDVENNGEPGGNRTRDHRIKSAMLYQLSYRPEDVSPSSIPRNSVHSERIVMMPGAFGSSGSSGASRSRCSSRRDTDV